MLADPTTETETYVVEFSRGYEQQLVATDGQISVTLRGPQQIAEGKPGYNPRTPTPDEADTLAIALVEAPFQSTIVKSSPGFEQHVGYKSGMVHMTLHGPNGHAYAPRIMTRDEAKQFALAHVRVAHDARIQTQSRF